MTAHSKIDPMWDDTPMDVTPEVNFIWSIANKLRGIYQADKYKDVIIPMTIIRRFECALAPSKAKVLKHWEAHPGSSALEMYRIADGYHFYNTSRYDLAELLNDCDNLAENLKSYIEPARQCRKQIDDFAEKHIDTIFIY